MEIKPIKTASRNFPTLRQTLDKPELLEKNAPARWLKNSAVAGALSVYLLAGCKSSDNAGDEKHRIELFASESGKTDKSNYDDKAAKKVAPIFVHGEGTASFACISMSSPVFLSENDARSVINDEFKKRGIPIVPEGPGLILTLNRWVYNDSKRKFELAPTDVEIFPDGYNKEWNLAYYYISTKDDEWLINYENRDVTGESVQTLMYADSLRSILFNKNTYNVAIFYDPIESCIFKVPDSDKWGYSEEVGKKRSTEQLKAQVADFIVWAKKEGLIK